MKPYFLLSKNQKKFLNPKPNGKWLPYPALCARFLQLKDLYLELKLENLKLERKLKMNNQSTFKNNRLKTQSNEPF